MSNSSKKYEDLAECGSEAATRSKKRQRQENGFIRTMGRELLVHNPQVNDVDTAIAIACEFVAKSYWEEECSLTHIPASDDYTALE
jgi:hypothetical protein